MSEDIIGRVPISETYLMDNMKFMSQFSNEFCTLVDADPPYGIGMEQGSHRAARIQFQNEDYGWDNKIPDKTYFDECKRISKYQIFWGGNYFLDILGKCKCYHVWDKQNPDRKFGDCEMAWTSFDEVPRVFSPKRVQELNRLDKGKIHPTQKPTSLYYWEFKKVMQYTGLQPHEMKIVDPNLGSGSSRIAAYILGIDFYGCDAKESFFNTQEERFRNFLAEKHLFLPKSEKVEIKNLLNIITPEQEKKESDLGFSF